MKYILVKWPDIQLISDTDEKVISSEYIDNVFIGYLASTESEPVYFVPEDLYNKYFVK